MPDLNETDFSLLLAPAPARTPSRAGVVVTSQDADWLPGLPLQQTQLDARQFNLPPLVVSVHYCTLGVLNLDCL